MNTPPPPARCGSPSRWRWAEPCRRTSCTKCWARFVERELARAMASFGGRAASQLGWLTINLGTESNLPGLCVRTAVRFRNSVDRERARGSTWDDVEVRALFHDCGSRLVLSGFVWLGLADPREFAQPLRRVWTDDAVVFEPFSGKPADESIVHFGAAWHAGVLSSLVSFRRLRLTIGARWSKATRHDPPVPTPPVCLEPMPISFGWQDEVLGSAARCC